MKIAVITDVHANYVALKRVVEHVDAWRPEEVVVAGDLVNRGPRPKECLDLVMERVQKRGWRLVRGNHEDYVLSNAAPDAVTKGTAFDVHLASYWTYQQLGGEVGPLLEMPFQQSFSHPKGGEVRVVHASMRGNRDGIFPTTTEEKLAKQIASPGEKPPAVLCVGHTHRPLIRSHHGSLVINAGSAGLPFDGDPRVSYAQIAWIDGKWYARVPRLAYDLQAAEEDFYKSGYLNGGGPLVELVLIELLQARSQLFQWADRYQQSVLDGEMTMAESVKLFLAGVH